MATARSLRVDMTDLFTHLTGQCLRLSRNPDSVMLVAILISLTKADGHLQTRRHIGLAPDR